MRLQLRLTLAVFTLWLNQTPAQDHSAADILDRYRESLVPGIESVSKLGRRCTPNGCRNLQYYRHGNSLVRMKLSFYWQTEEVWVVSGDSSWVFYEGPWYQRAWLWLSGVKSHPMDRTETAYAKRDEQAMLIGFLRDRSSFPNNYEGMVRTANGNMAHSFFQNASDRNVMVRFLFDPVTNLCVERRIVLPTGEESFVSYSDYRLVNGLPYPFKTRLWSKQGLTEEEILDDVKFGGSVDSMHFSTTPKEISYGKFLVTALCGAIAGVLLLRALRKRRHLRTA